MAKPTKMNSIEETLWRRVDARKRETHKLQEDHNLLEDKASRIYKSVYGLAKRISVIEKTYHQYCIDVARAEIENHMADKNQEKTEVVPDFLVYNLGERTGSFWAKEEEEYVAYWYDKLMTQRVNEEGFKDIESMSESVCDEIAHQIGRTSHAVWCRLSQLGYDSDLSV